MRRFIRSSLSLRVLLVTVLLFAVPMMLYLLIVLHQSWGAHLRDTVIRLRDLGKSRALILAELNAANMRTINITAAIMALDHKPKKGAPVVEQFGSVEHLNGIFRSVAQGGDFQSVFFLTTEGKEKFHVIASSSSELMGEDMSSYNFVKDVMLQGQTSFLSYGNDAFEKYMLVAKLIYGRQDFQPIGILVVSNRVDDLLSRLLSSEESTYKVDFSLVMADGVIFASSNPDLALRYFNELNEADLQELRDEHRIDPKTLKHNGLTVINVEDVPGAAILEWGDNRQLAIEVPVKGTSFALLLDASEEEVLGEQRMQIIWIVIIFLVILAVGGVAAFWMTQRVAKPLRQLREVMSRVSEGDWSARFERSPLGFEINDVGMIFNNTMDSLVEQRARAEEEHTAKEALKTELAIGTDIQMSLLPRQRIEYPGLEIAARFAPAKEVGGDFYDILVKEGGELVLTVADASGKGISACLYSFTLRSMLRSYAISYENVTNIMRKANNIFCHDTGETGMFVTAFVAIYHPESRMLTYSSCGHNPGILRRKDGSLERLVTPGIPLGVQPLEEVPEVSVQLHPGDTLLLYTDGVTEALNTEEELYGLPRLEEYFKEKGDRSAEEVADGILAELETFAGDAPQADDITLMAISVTS